MQIVCGFRKNNRVTLVRNTPYLPFCQNHHNFIGKKLHIYKIMCTFAAEMVMHGCFIRARKGNQVQILSSTRYCNPHYVKSKRSHLQRKLKN